MSYELVWEAKASATVTCALDAGSVITIGEPRRKKAVVLTRADREVKRNLWSIYEAAELLGLSYGGFKAAADRVARRFNVTGQRVGKRVYYTDADLNWIRREALGQGQHEL